MDATTIQALEDLARAANYRQQQAQARADQIAGEVSQVEIFLQAKRQQLADAQQAIAPAQPPPQAQPQAQPVYAQPPAQPVYAQPGQAPYPYPVVSPYAQPQPAPQPPPQRAQPMPEPRNLGELAVQNFVARQAERAYRGEGNPLTNPNLPMGLGPVANWRRPGIGDVVIPHVYF